METSAKTQNKDNPSAVGIIAEYNPFHNGHAYQIKKAKELSGADFCIIVMSGDFVQRGAPAVFDKYTRAHMALLSGADLVVEIPPAFAVSSAEDFAACAVALLDRMGVVSHLCFGSESGKIGPLVQVAQLLVHEPEAFRTALKRELKKGLTFPQARIMALKQFPFSAEDPASLLSTPNNILGVEYVKALIRQNSSITPVTLKRQGSGYHDIGLPGWDNSDFSRSSYLPSIHDQPRIPSTDCCFASASAIRNALNGIHNGPSGASLIHFESSLKHLVPDSTWNLMVMGHCRPVFPNDFSALMSYRLLELLRQDVDLSRFGDVSQELAARIRRQALEPISLEKRVETLKTRQYTYTRISRSLIHILLHITKEELSCRKDHDYVSYVRILGFKKEAAPLLTQLKKAATLPIITKTADAPHILSAEAMQEFYNDLFCSHVYESVAGVKKEGRCTNEYTHPLIIL